MFWLALDAEGMQLPKAALAAFDSQCVLPAGCNSGCMQEGSVTIGCKQFPQSIADQQILLTKCLFDLHAEDLYID